MTNKKTACFCNHIRAALACYVDMTPEQQALAAMYANRKVTGLHNLRAAAVSPGGRVTAFQAQCHLRRWAFLFALVRP